MNKLISLFVILITFSFSQNVLANSSGELNRDINLLTKTFLNSAKQNNVPVTAVEVSVLLPNENQPRDFVAGVKQKDGQLASTKNLVQYGSITKEYTAALILKLVDEGKITLQTPLIKLFPEKFTKNKWPQQWSNVTPEQLLNMTSGITTYSMPKIINTINPYYTNYSLNRLVSLAAKYQMKNGCNQDNLCFKPGTNWGYSNTNYIIAGMIIEKYFKKSYGSMLEKFIIKPLQKQYSVPIYYAMQYNTYLYRNMLHGYLPEETANELDSPLFSPNQDVTIVPLDYVGPAGGLTGTTHALTLLTRAWFDTNLFPGHDKIQKVGLVLPSKKGENVSNKDINSKCLSKVKGCYGLGVGVMYDKKYGQIWMYTGNYLGYATTYAYFKNTKTIIALSQNAGATGQYHQVANHTIDAIYEEVLMYLDKAK
ncbi:MAG: class A beta-lactamase-related serine hydrolase [Gammaproteobacteria bacterium]|nr:MAG: class A beta-lactamase-related serine hydrolase [Gammaproteobacteria bacterium]UTW43487.1 beta-lactamase family protein [bacterium SCSIO 12844]